ncbi:MAG TPA: hypothetical protein VH107_15105 [Lacipirellulaceae bacterium]|jgi:hypothetical protein|nr:hypothetical protein [Lacipirellulaceae bacterium]
MVDPLPVKESLFRRILPGISLMFAAPMIAEVLPGATRMSSVFVFPLEFVIWGGGALVVRALARRQQLGWANLLLLAVALSLSEELLIHQTSLAPVIIKLKGVEYARAFGVNYVYLTWAVSYEVIFVVFIPVTLVELVFYERRNETWLNAAGAVILGLLFVPACFLAWFLWTHIVREKVLHLEPYVAPRSYVIVSAGLIAVLIWLAIGPAARRLARQSARLRPPWPPAMFVFSGMASVVVYCLILLGFGIWPEFPPLVAVAIGVVLAAVIVGFLPRFCAHESWGLWHTVAVLYGATLTMMAVFFFGFQGSSPVDFYGKVAVDLIAVGWLAWLAWRLPKLTLNADCGGA